MSRPDVRPPAWREFPRAAPLAPQAETVLTIGNFDGVHRGHQALLNRAAELARPRNAAALAITFEPHPIRLLAPLRAPARLSTFSERIAFLHQAGADSVICLQTDHSLLNLTAEDFLNQVILPLRPVGLVEGPTFHFGRDRAGDSATLADFARRHGLVFEVLTERLNDEPAAPRAINSSAIRAAIASGDLEQAAAMLGRPYRLRGIIGNGAGRGAGIGVPTANLDRIETLMPRLGVYAAVAETTSGDLQLAAVNIGPQPTFAGQECRVEAHLLDFERDIRGQWLGLHLLHRIRDQVKFENVAQLMTQIRADIEVARRYAPHLATLRAAARAPLTENLSMEVG